MKRSSLASAIAAIVLSLGTIGYQAHEISRRRTSLFNDQKRLDRLELQLAGLKSERDEAARQLEHVNRVLHGAPAQASNNTNADSARTAELNTWLARLKLLKQSFDDHPEQRIPEFQFLTDLDWMTLARSLRFESEEDRRKAWAEVRATAFGKFRDLLGPALIDYATAAKGVPLLDLAQLLPYFKPPIDPVLLQRYEITGAMPIAGKRDHRKISQRLPVDEDFDTRHTVSIDGRGSASAPWATDFIRRSVEEAMQAFTAANSGREPGDGDDISPYIQDPNHRAIIAAMEAYGEDHQGRRWREPEDLRPYITNPAALPLLEKMSRAEANR